MAADKIIIAISFALALSSCTRQPRQEILGPLQDSNPAPDHHYYYHHSIPTPVPVPDPAPVPDPVSAPVPADLKRKIENLSDDIQSAKDKEPRRNGINPR